MWERAPWKIAAIYSGDGFVKTVLIAAVLARRVATVKVGLGQFRGECATCST